MRNPLIKRLPRELKNDFGKYLVIFLFMVMLISLVSGFLITDNNFKNAYDKGFETYNIEDGHITFDKEVPATLLSEIEDAADLKFYDLRYFEENLDLEGKSVRIYKVRSIVDTECLMSGQMPQSDNEIALDRMFCANNSLSVGDKIILNNKELVISGLVALPDYSCLFKNNSDMMFDSINFGVGVMTEDGFEKLNSKSISYNYAWKYNNAPLNDVEENQLSEDFIDVLEDILKEYDINILQVQIDALYDKADELQAELENQFEEAGNEIEEKIKSAATSASEKAATKEQGTSLNALIAIELGTTEEALTAMTDSFDSLEDMTDDLDSSKGQRIDLHDLEDAEDYENDMDFSFDEIYDVLYKIDVTGIYDTSSIRLNLSELEALMDFEPDESEIIEVEDYVARYNNKAINFTGDDLGKDAAMFTIFTYIVILILAFVFAVTTTNTITQEAGVIGTLRASGYTRGELIRHYLFLPVAVTIVAAVVGNILGYTVLKDRYVDLYYNSYSLATYEDLWNKEAFINTTVVPIILMFVINLFVLIDKMKLSPLKFLRRDLVRRQKKKAMRLNTKIPIMHRFRIRIFFQNIPAYITLFVGIFLGSVIVVFGTMFGPLLDDYSNLVAESQIAANQYVLINQVETEIEGAEKYCIRSLDYEKEGYLTDEISIYGIAPESNYINADIPANQVLLSNGLMDKYGLNPGDTITLKDHFNSDTYTFTISGEYKYDAALSVFMNMDEFNETFKEDEDYFTGYFSNELLTDIDDDDIATIITVKDLQKMANQLKQSMGDFMSLFKYFGVAMFVLLMYLMTKQIIEKNQVSISMTKILGFKAGEIGGLYLVITSFVVLASLLISIPICDAALRWVFHSLMYTMMTGYIPYIISNNCYIVMVIIGVVCYIFISAFMMLKINRIPKSDALKNVE